MGEGPLAEAVLGTLEGNKHARRELFILAGRGEYRLVGLLTSWLEREEKNLRRAARKALNRIYRSMKRYWQELVCPEDLHRFQTKTQGALWGKTRWWACRQCGKTRFIRAKQVVCLLDEALPEETELKDGQLRVNWLRRKERTRLLFDFDRVEIVGAEDIEVHRLCMDVHGDIDADRRRRYKQLACRVWPGVELAPNTWQLLRHTFGQVERLPAAGGAEGKGGVGFSVGSMR